MALILLLNGECTSKDRSVEDTHPETGVFNHTGGKGNHVVCRGQGARPKGGVRPDCPHVQQVAQQRRQLPVVPKSGWSRRQAAVHLTSRCLDFVHDLVHIGVHRCTLERAQHHTQLPAHIQ